MKLYLAMCSFCLLAGAALGHLNGKYSAVSDFVNSCESIKFVVIQDRAADFSRQFHCFEVIPAEHHKKREIKKPQPASPTPAWAGRS